MRSRCVGLRLRKTRTFRGLPMDLPNPAAAATPSMLLHLLAEDSESERLRLVGEVVARLGFDWLAHGPMRRGSDGVEMTESWRSVGAEGWRRRYRAQGHARRDPRLAAALASRLPVVWQFDALRRDAPAAARAFFDELGDTGMRSGVMLALDGLRADERCVVSLLSRRADPRLVDDDARIGQVV